jgi:hypothetical protein
MIQRSSFARRLYLLLNVPRAQVGEGSQGPDDLCAHPTFVRGVLSRSPAQVSSSTSRTTIPLPGTRRPQMRVSATGGGCPGKTVAT